MPASGTSTFIVLCKRYCHVVVMLSVIDFVFCIPFQIDVLCIPSEIVLRADLDSFKEGVCQINHQSP